MSGIDVRFTWNPDREPAVMPQASTRALFKRWMKNDTDGNIDRHDLADDFDHYFVGLRAGYATGFTRVEAEATELVTLLILEKEDKLDAAGSARLAKFREVEALPMLGKRPSFDAPPMPASPLPDLWRPISEYQDGHTVLFCWKSVSDYFSERAGRVALGYVADGRFFLGGAAFSDDDDFQARPPSHFIPWGPPRDNKVVVPAKIQTGLGE